MIFVHGVIFSHYAIEDRTAEAYAMVLLFESGYADQNDIARCFGYSARSLRRYQERLKVGGLSALARPEGRPLMQMALQNTADIDPTDNRLLITLSPLSSPHRSRALEALCEVLNKTNTLFPGTPLQMSYSVAPHRSEAKSGQVFDKLCQEI